MIHRLPAEKTRCGILGELAGDVDLKQVSEDDLYNNCDAVPLEMEPGDVLFHCLSTPHGSSFNHSDKQRRIFYVHYVNEDVYQDGYAPETWAKDWNEERRQLIQLMLPEAGRNELRIRRLGRGSQA